MSDKIYPGGLNPESLRFYLPNHEVHIMPIPDSSKAVSMPAIFAALDKLTDEQRLEIFQYYCSSCGCKHNRKKDTNDEHTSSCQC